MIPGTALPSPTGSAPGGVDELSAVELLETASQAVRDRRLAEVAEMRLAAQWAALHGHPEQPRDPMVTPGGAGTPAVRELALPELAMARGTHYATTKALLADTLDLQHRLPRTWARTEAGECEPWLARKASVLSRAVPLATIGIVDRAVAAAITGHAPSTVLEIVAAKVIEADPEAYAMRKEAERHQRYVSLSRTDEWGYRHVIARVNAGDAAWFDALIDRTADVLALTHGHDHNRDELRSLAVGWLARPADLLKLLLDHTEPAQSEPEHPHASQERPAWAPGHLDRTLGRLAALSTRQLAALRGRGVVYVHLEESALRRQAGLARVEAQGPMLVQMLAELLGHADVALKPVIDLHARTAVDRYEHPDALKERVWLTAGGAAFPHAPRTAHREHVDFDHVRPYVPDGPTGQTGTHNSAPLRRSHHRWKTIGGYRCRQAGPGRYLWQSPHGVTTLVDPTGTHRLPPDQAELILSAPPGVDLYPQPDRIDLRFEPAAS